VIVVGQNPGKAGSVEVQHYRVRGTKTMTQLLRAKMSLKRKAQEAIFLLLSLVCTLAHSQVKQGFTFCEILDAENYKTYASPIFPVEWHAGKEFQRSQELANEFLEVVAVLGGKGLKNCNPPLESRAKTEAERAESRKLGTSATLSKWQDVAFQPKPWNPSAPPPTGSKTWYYFCSAGDANRDVRKGAATGIFSGIVPLGNADAPYALMRLYQEEFIRDVVPGLGIPNGNPSCLGYESLSEAQSAWASTTSIWKGVGGFNTTFLDINWQPTSKLTLAQIVNSTPNERRVESNPAVKEALLKPPAPKGFIGARVLPLTQETMNATGARSTEGLEIIEILPDKAAARSALQVNDVILKVAGSPISDFTSFQQALGRVPDGQTVIFSILRAKSTLELPVGPIQSETPALPPGQNYSFAAALQTKPTITEYCVIQGESPQASPPRALRTRVFKTEGDGSVQVALHRFQSFVRQANKNQPALWSAPESARCDGSACSSSGGTPFQVILLICFPEREKTDVVFSGFERQKAMNTIDFIPE